MPVALYNKYRPRRLQDIKGQQNTSILINSVRQKRIYSAYLFMGSYGTGKTTSARLFAQAMNCDRLDSFLNPCFECPACEKPRGYLIEIDGASNRGIKDILKVIESSKYRPKTGKRKVVIIDEFHQLSTDAISALLKIVEEPPEHLTYIFCTTDNLRGSTDHAEALETLSSRCMSLLFSPISPDIIMKEVKMIARRESIYLKDDTLRLIARRARGSMRDAIGLIDLYSLMQDVTTLITPEEEYALRLLECLVENKPAVRLIKDIEDGFIEPAILWDYMLEFTRDIMFCGLNYTLPHVSEVQDRIDQLSNTNYKWDGLQKKLISRDVPKDYLKLQSELLGL